MSTTEAPPAAAGVIGQRLLRREDPALLTGEVRFTNDLDVPGALHLAVVRSPYAHADITRIDTAAAAAMPGVVAVYTSEDLAEAWAAPMPCACPVTEDMKSPAHYPLARGKVCYVGDGVVAVIARSETAALDAVEAVEVTYEPLPAVIGLEDALSDRVVIHDDLGTNRSYTWVLKVEGAEGQIDQAFADAAHVVRERYVQQRLIPMAVDVLQYVAVDDCGVQINPLIVDGQVHGGVIQGLAQALFEEAVYDSDGNLKTSSLAEYLVPAASDVPSITLGHTVTPSPTNQLGVKGVGEAGTIGAAPAVINAVVDALSGLGVTDVPMPASPLNVWNAIHGVATKPDTAGTDVGDHPGVTARTTTPGDAET